MPIIRLDDPNPDVLDGRHIRASAFEAAQRELIGRLSEKRVFRATARSEALTIGAGYARLPHFLAAAGYRVTAIDPSAKATDVAREQAAVDGVSVDYRTGDDASLPGPDSSYDVVWCIDTLEIAPDPHGTLAEIARLARPGGTTVLDTVNNTVVSRGISRSVSAAAIHTHHAGRSVPPRTIAHAREFGRGLQRRRHYRRGSHRVRTELAGCPTARSARSKARQHSRQRTCRGRSVPALPAGTHTPGYLLRAGHLEWRICRVRHRRPPSRPSR